MQVPVDRFISRLQSQPDPAHVMALPVITYVYVRPILARAWPTITTQVVTAVNGTVQLPLREADMSCTDGIR